MTENGARLLFVYNADSGVMQALRDAVHKTVSPETYGCNLCALTYGSLGMRRRWRGFVDGLPLPAVFVHRDEFRDGYDRDVALPAAFVEEDGELSLLLSADEINGCGTLDELMALVEEKVGELSAMRGL